MCRGESGRQKPALRPPPRTEVDAAAGNGRHRCSKSSGTSAWRTMLSKPLANPSTLDRRIAAALLRSDVRRGGALEPGALALAENVQAKAAGYSTCHIAATSAEGPFSLRRGLEFGCVSSAEHHLVNKWGFLAPETTKATQTGRPRSSCYTASPLARTPPGKGRRGIQPVPAKGGRVPAEARGDLGRFANECVVNGGLQVGIRPVEWMIL
jgi:hypothetical protein